MPSYLGRGKITALNRSPPTHTHTHTHKNTQTHTHTDTNTHTHTKHSNRVSGLKKDLPLIGHWLDSFDVLRTFALHHNTMSEIPQNRNKTFPKQKKTFNFELHEGLKSPKIKKWDTSIAKISPGLKKIFNFEDLKFP